LYEQLKRGNGRVVAASCRPHQKSHIFQNAQYSVFTDALVDALDYHAGNSKNYATILRTLTYISETVISQLGGSQTPVFNMDNAEDFVICRINTALATKEPFKKTAAYLGDSYIDRPEQDEPASVDKARNKLRYNIPIKPTYFIGRKNKLVEIHKKLTGIKQRDNVLLLSGIGGMGKTTLMQEYLHQRKCNEHFDGIVTISVNKNLQSAFVSGMAAALGVDMKAFKTAEEQLQEMLQRMKQCSGKNLLVIDNINQEDFYDLVSMKTHFNSTGWKVLITTRTAPDGFSVVQVGELDMEEAVLLFAHHYVQRQNNESEKLAQQYLSNKKIKEDIEKLLEHIVRHTLLTELLAKVGRKKSITVKDLLVLLENQDFRNPELQRVIEIGSHEDNTFRKELNIKTLHLYLLNLFETEYLVRKTNEEDKDQENEAKATMLRFFSILPPDDIPIGDLKKLWRVDKASQNPFEDRLDELMQIGWIQGKQELLKAVDSMENLAYKMHPLVQEVVYEKLKPDINTCRPLVKTITEILAQPLTYPQAYQNYAKSVIDKLNLLSRNHN
ncbi:MAG: NB-ARC domain-containing protein, partial [Chitinophagaceae bacterium]